MNSRLLFLILLFVGLALSSQCHLDHGLEPIRSGISGTITYKSDWPAETAEVRLVAATVFPPTEVQQLTIGETLPLGMASYDYIFYLKPGIYKLIGVAWREKDVAWNVQNVFGICFADSDYFTPKEINVATDTTLVRNINFTADFAHVRKSSRSTIEGTITFVGNWPDSVEELRVVASTQFPPSSLFDITFGDPLRLNVDSTSYTLRVSPGEYRLIVVVLKKQNQPWDFNNITNHIVALRLGLIEVPTKDSHITGIDLVVNFNQYLNSVWTKTSRNCHFERSEKSVVNGNVGLIQISPPTSRGSK